MLRNVYIKKNNNNLEKLYALLGISIFVHYILTGIITILIVLNLIFTKEYKKIIKDKSLIIVEIVLACSLVMAIYYENWYGLVAIPIMICLIAVDIIP